MAALAAAASRNNVDDVSIIGPQVVNSSVLYAGGFQSVNSRDHGTAASVGRVQPYSSSSNQIPAGFQRAANTTGDTAATPIPRSNLWVGPVIVKSLAITGLAGTFADVGRLFYATTDNDFTLTRTDPDIALGIITDFQTSSVATARFFSMAELAILAMAGTGQAACPIALISAGSVTGNIVTSWLAPCHGRITEVSGQVLIEATDADVDLLVNLEIGGTNVTGGVVNILFNSAIGVKLAGTAVTAANVFHAGDAIDVEVVASVAGTLTDPGLTTIWMVYLMEPGL